MSNSDPMDIASLLERLQAAEKVCVLFGWSPVASHHLEVEDAALEAWMHWSHLAGPDATDPRKQRQIEAEIPNLATARRAKEAKILSLVEES